MHYNYAESGKKSEIRRKYNVVCVGGKKKFSKIY